MIPHHWNRAAADNGSADPNADLRPGRPANTVLGSIRGLMATGAAARDDAIGGLVAALGASNVYSVQSNEGLIDIATGINGVPSAITKPFLLRVAFGSALVGATTTTPHLAVDGFDCGPILRSNGSPLADGDLTVGRPLLVLGDMALSTDTKVTRVRVLDLVPSQYGQVGPPYSQFVAGTYTDITVMSEVADVEIWGGGGGSGGVGATNNGSSSGGGGGGYSRKRLTGLVIGSKLTLIVGAGGVAGLVGGYGGPGGTTSLGSYCSATGGQGGSPNSVGTGGAGGTGSGGDVNLNGGYGSAGAVFGSATGGTGGGASQGGGAGGGGAPGIGAPGTGPGGGGGGSGSTTINPGAPGAPGGCIITWE